MTRADARDGRALIPPGRPPDARSSPQLREGSAAEILPPGADSGRTPRRVAVLLALSDERDAWLDRVLDAWREGYQAALSDAVVESLRRIWPAPGRVTEIDKRRYGPGGREHFADPRPGDYQGRRHG